MHLLYDLAQKRLCPQSMFLSTDQSLVVNLLSDEFILAQRVAGFSCDCIYWSLFHLLLHGTVQHEERFSSTFLKKVRHTVVLWSRKRQVSRKSDKRLYEEQKKERKTYCTKRKLNTELFKNFPSKKHNSKKCIAFQSNSSIIFLIFFKTTTGEAVKDKATACVG